MGIDNVMASRVCLFSKACLTSNDDLLIAIKLSLLIIVTPTKLPGAQIDLQKQWQSIGIVW